MRSIFHLVCESGRVVGDEMEVCLKQIQVAVMHILREHKHRDHDVFILAEL